MYLQRQDQLEDFRNVTRTVRERGGTRRLKDSTRTDDTRNVHKLRRARRRTQMLTRLERWRGVVMYGVLVLFGELVLILFT